MSAACRSSTCRASRARSNYTLRRLLRLWLSMFLNFSVMPLRFATLFGLGFGALGALAAIVSSSRRSSRAAAAGLGLADGRACWCWPACSSSWSA